MVRIEEASLEEIFEIMLDPEVFPDDGEFQTVFGLFKHELASIRENYNRSDVHMLNDIGKLRDGMLNMLLGYPHNCEKLILERYGYDVRDLD